MKVKLPPQVNIMGTIYTITYVDKPSDVSHDGRSALWGEIDFWTRSIRVYKNDRTAISILKTVVHETLHGIVHETGVTSLSATDPKGHKELDLLARVIVDTFTRNGWLRLPPASEEEIKQVPAPVDLGTNDKKGSK